MIPARFDIIHDAPQGSVLEPIILLHTAYADSMTDRHGLLSHLYVDDSQLHLSGQQDTIPVLQSKLDERFTKIDSVIASKKLKPNQDTSDNVR